jgi:hypothetical protein
LSASRKAQVPPPKLHLVLGLVLSGFRAGIAKLEVLAQQQRAPRVEVFARVRRRLEPRQPHRPRQRQVRWRLELPVANADGQERLAAAERDGGDGLRRVDSQSDLPSRVAIGGQAESDDEDRGAKGRHQKIPLLRNAIITALC